MLIPSPSRKLAEPTIKIVPKGSILHRVHDHNFAGNSFNPTSDVFSRFSPIFDEKGKVVPVLYTADTLNAAIYESIFHDITARSSVKKVALENVYKKNHTVLKTTQEFRLAELRQPDLIKWNISRNELIASFPEFYPYTCKWSQAIHDQFTDEMGLVWTSNQCDPDSAFVFFGNRILKNWLEIESVRKGEDDIAFLTDVISAGVRSSTKVSD